VKLFYAVGGGFGHLSRTKLYQTQQDITNFKVLTANPQVASQFFGPDRVVSLSAGSKGKDKKAWTANLNTFLAKERIDELIIDTFPNGIFGELSDLKPQLPIYKKLIARRMIWDAYSSKAGSIIFDKVDLVENLEEKHFNYLKKHSKQIRNYKLVYPTLTNLPIDQRNYITVMHTSSVDELKRLIEIAEEQQGKFPNCSILILSELTLSDLSYEQIQTTNPQTYLEKSAVVITAAGFNSVYQLADFKGKRIIVPFPRKYDDQFWRANYFLNS
jgi:hypothetical protein